MNLKLLKQVTIFTGIYFLADFHLNTFAQTGTQAADAINETKLETLTSKDDSKNGFNPTQLFDIESRANIIVFKNAKAQDIETLAKRYGIEKENITKINNTFYHINSTQYVFRYYFLILILSFAGSQISRKIKEDKKISEVNRLIKLLNENNIDDECVSDHIKSMSLSPGIKKTIETAKNNKMQFVNELNDHIKNLSITEAKVEFLNMCLNNQYKEAKLHEYRFQELMHEVSTPLSATLKQITKLKGQVDHKTYPMIKEIYDNSSFALVATQMALRKHLLGDKVSTLTSINMRELIEQSFKMASNGRNSSLFDLDFSIGINSNHSDNPINLISDKSLLQSIFINIFNNSLKYSNKSKLQVNLDHQLDQQNSKVTHTTITIEDEGTGFSEEFLNNFEVIQSRNVGEASFGIGLRLVNEYLTKLGSTLTLSNARDNKRNVSGAKCSFTISSHYNVTEKELFSKHCSVAFYSENMQLRERIKTIFNEKAIKINFVSDEELEINSNNTVLLIEYALHKFTTRDIRLAASQHDDITTILICGEEEYRHVQESDILLPYECEEEGIIYDNIFAIPKPVTSEEIFTIINDTKGLDESSLSKQNLDVLIIEDHMSERESLISLLGKCFNVKVAQNFNEAQKCLKHFNFDLVISDINFSDGNSVNKLKSNFLNSKAFKIAHTGLSPDSERVLEVKDMFNAVTQKASDYTELTDIIEGHFKRKMPVETIPLNQINEENKIEFYNLKSKIENENLQEDFPRYVAIIHRTVNTLNKLGIVDGDEEALMRHEHSLHLKRQVEQSDHDKTLNLLNKLANEVNSK